MRTTIEKNAINCSRLQLEKAVNIHAAGLLKSRNSGDVIQNILFRKDGSICYTDGRQLVLIQNYTEPAEADTLINAISGAIYDGPGTYPDVKRLIPGTDGPAAAAFDLNELLQIAEPLKNEIRKMGTDKTQAVKLSFFDDLILINDPRLTADFISAELRTQTKVYDDSFSFSVDLKRLLNTLKFLKKLKIKEIELYFISPLRPIVFKADNIIFLLMPLRIN